MGLPMVRRLVAAGHDVRVLARRAEVVEGLVAEGVAAGCDAAACVDGAEVVVVCLYDEDQVRALLAGPLVGALAPGAVVVVHTTGSPRTVEGLAARGVRVVDAPVSGGPPDIAAGRLSVFAGGSERDVERVRPVVTAYAGPLLHVGPLGNGQRVKLVNNVLFAAQLGLLDEAVRLASALGVDEGLLLAALEHGSAGGRAVERAAARGSVAAFADAAAAFLGKDLDVACRTGAELSFELAELVPALRRLAAYVEGRADVRNR